jgi:hypothetical protein
MATCHFERTVYKRSSTTVPASDRIAYIQREGQYDPATARVRYLERDGLTERLRDDLIDTDVHNLPLWAEGRAATFFTAAEAHERVAGVAYTEWKFSLPRELSRDQQLAAAKDLMTLHFDTQHPYVWAMHEPVAADLGTNPHVHCIWSSRTLDGIERSPEQFFRQWQRTHPERGGARKNPDLIAWGEAKRERVVYTDVMNLHLDRAGSLERLHPASHKARGLEREPEPHVLPSDSKAAKFDHEITDRWAKVLANRAERPAYAAAEAANTRQYWEQRKHYLGITPTLTHEQALERIAQVRAQSLTQVPTRQTAAELARQAEQVERSIQTLEAEQRIIARRRHHVRLSPERSADDRIGGGSFRVKLHEEDYERRQSPHRGF